MTALGFSDRAVTTALVLDEVLSERQAQFRKWGEQNPDDISDDPTYRTLRGDAMREACEVSFNRGQVTWTHILCEELGEALDEARDGNATALRAELVQLAAVAVAWIESLDRRTLRLEEMAA